MNGDLQHELMGRPGLVEICCFVPFSKEESPVFVFVPFEVSVLSDVPDWSQGET